MKNREIKFEYIFSNEDKSILKEVFTIEQIEAGNVMDWFDDNPLLKDFKIISRRQYTGLKDSKGKDIYESDIIKVGDDKPIVVGWSEMFASFVLERDGWAFSHWFGESCNPQDCEIIGNLFETPELLK